MDIRGIEDIINININKDVLRICNDRPVLMRYVLGFLPHPQQMEYFYFTVFTFKD